MRQSSREKVRHAILNCPEFARGISAEEIKAATGLKTQTVFAAIRSLKADKHIEQRAEGAAWESDGTCVDEAPEGDREPTYFYRSLGADGME